MVEAGFNYVDVNGDGKVDKKEWQCIMKGGPCPPKGPNAAMMLHEVTQEQWDWIGDAIKAEFEKDGDLTLEELLHGVTLFEKEFDVKVHQNVVDAIVALFHTADKNNDGKVTTEEVAAAAEA